MIKVYEYRACSTCRKAIKFLESHQVNFERIAIVDTPPSLAELKRMLAIVTEAGGSIRSLFNTSGVQYRELGLAERLKAGLSEAEALKLLAANGKLIKRPFLLTPKSGAVGFDEATWARVLK